MTQVRNGFYRYATAAAVVVWALIPLSQMLFHISTSLPIKLAYVASMLAASVLYLAGAYVGAMNFKWLVFVTMLMLLALSIAAAVFVPVHP